MFELRVESVGVNPRISRIARIGILLDFAHGVFEFADEEIELERGFGFGRVGIGHDDVGEDFAEVLELWWSKFLTANQHDLPSLPIFSFS